MIKLSTHFGVNYNSTRFVSAQLIATALASVDFAVFTVSAYGEAEKLYASKLRTVLGNATLNTTTEWQAQDWCVVMASRSAECLHNHSIVDLKSGKGQVLQVSDDSPVWRSGNAEEISMPTFGSTPVIVAGSAFLFGLVVFGITCMCDHGCKRCKNNDEEIDLEMTDFY